MDDRHWEMVGRSFGHLCIGVNAEFPKYVPREMSLELASDFRAINTACFQHCLQGKMG